MKRSNPAAYAQARRRNRVRMVPAFDGDGNETREAKIVAAENVVRGDLSLDGVAAMPVHLVRVAGEGTACGAAEGFGVDTTDRDGAVTCAECLAVRESTPRMPVKKALPREDDSEVELMTGRAGR